jgi:hypothetical protein
MTKMKMKILIGNVIANESRHLLKPQNCGNSLSHFQCENFEFDGSSSFKIFKQCVRNGWQK